MSDVQVNQSPGNAPQPVATGGGSGAVWAIVVIVLLAIIAWFVFGRGMMGRGDGSRDINANVKIETPAAPAPAAPATKAPATKAP